MKALVTGSRGFLGRYIAEQLRARGDHVRGFSRRATPELECLGIESVAGDIRDLEAITRACSGMEVVFHTAAVAGIWGPWDQYYGINVLGTRNVLAACRAQGVKGLVYTSSPSVTFDGSPQSGVDESVEYSRRWLCNYPHTKAIAEQLVLESHAADGMRTCALRPHLIWGPRDEHLIPRLVARAREGKLRRVGDGENKIDVIYVENAAAAHLLAADALVSRGTNGGNAYFLSQGHPVNCWDWINELLAVYGLPAICKSVSFASAWRIGAGLEFLHRLLKIRREPRMTRFLAAQLACDHYFDIRRARRDFGYVPAISLAEGMARLAACQAGRK